MYAKKKLKKQKKHANREVELHLLKYHIELEKMYNGGNMIFCNNKTKANIIKSF